MIEYKQSRRMVIIDRKNNIFEEFRDKGVLGDYLGVPHATVTGWFRVQENGLKPKTKVYNNLEIICIDGEYRKKQKKGHGNLPNPSRSSRDDT